MTKHKKFTSISISQNIHVKIMINQGHFLYVVA